LPLVYDELRRLAAAKLKREKPGQTLQATALVHDAYVRLVDRKHTQEWDSRGHFFSAAAEAMRKILIDQYRKKAANKHGGNLQRIALAEVDPAQADQGFDLLALDEALQQLESIDPTAAGLAKLRIFAGLSVDDAGSALGIPHTSAYRQWTYAQAWLHARLSGLE
jgi:RNA polymerase sigma factor (TIGR02999 family)